MFLEANGAMCVWLGGEQTVGFYVFCLHLTWVML